MLRPSSRHPKVLMLVAGVALPPSSAVAQQAAHAQTPSSAPSAAPLYPRPRLVAGADTNEAINYLLAGEGRLRDDPAFAAAAGYWAERIDPGSARASMLRWQATWLSSPDLVRRLYRDPGRALKDSATRAAVERIDSLYLRALLRDPFEAVDPALRKYPPPAPPDLARRLAARPNDVELRVYEAARSFRRQEYDSAVGYLNAALAILDRRQREAREIERVYLSRVIFHFASGRALEAAGRVEEAQKAYGAALAEDLSFAAAHAALARIAWRDWSDSATALREYRLALDLADDPVTRLSLARLLFDLGDPEAAVAEVDRSLVSAPDYAEAYHFCGEANSAIGRPARALECYRAYLARAPRRLTETRATAQRQIATLEQLIASPVTSP